MFQNPPENAWIVLRPLSLTNPETHYRLKPFAAMPCLYATRSESAAAFSAHQTLESIGVHRYQIVFDTLIDETANIGQGWQKPWWLVRFSQNELRYGIFTAEHETVLLETLCEVSRGYEVYFKYEQARLTPCAVRTHAFSRVEPQPLRGEQRYYLPLSRFILLDGERFAVRVPCRDKRGAGAVGIAVESSKLGGVLADAKDKRGVWRGHAVMS